MAYRQQRYLSVTIMLSNHPGTHANMAKQFNPNRSEEIDDEHMYSSIIHVETWYVAGLPARALVPV